ncbi:MAG: hypothetical protein JWM86_2570 [Thermoleophilia bacterium]|nr:hypothetical protein [Thermoleophilia bacterium]
MPNRTFLGLILLIIALVVASTPALLTPTARGVEAVGVRAGVIKQQTPSTRGSDTSASSKADTPVKPYLAMRGYQLERDGDLRDVAGDTRPTDGRGRLATGSTRIAMPGEALRTATDSPPVTTEGGVLLDATGCPLFAEDADVATLMADPDAASLYATKAGDADDPAACATLLQARVDAATATPATTLPGDRRALASALRDDSQRMLMETYASDMFLAMFGQDGAGTTTLAKDLRTQLRGSR